MKKEVNKDLIKLKEALKEFCQLYYLPFTSNNLPKADEIIKDFINRINTRKLQKINGGSLTSLNTFYGINPFFNQLDNLNTWDTQRIEKYSGIVKMDKDNFMDVLRKQGAWGKPEMKRNIDFSRTIIDLLNEKEKRNGRLKIILKLTRGKTIKVQFYKIQKIIEYQIPAALHKEWMVKVKRKNYRFEENVNEFTFNLQIEAKKIIDINIKCKIPLTIKDTQYLGFGGGKTNQEFKQLAATILSVALKHSIYIDNNSVLLFCFSNNTVLEDEGIGRDVGLGGLFVLLNKEVVWDYNDPSHVTQSILNSFSRLSDALSSRLINFYELEQVRKQATRAAISQVMARNMSHNIGSHVMNALVSSGYLEKFCPNKASLKSYQPDREIVDSKDNNNFGQLAIYNNYVKTRMDYLADITFGVPAMLMTKKAFSDIFCEMDKARLLLDNISGRGDKFKYNIQFVDGNDQLLDDNNDIPLAIPNDVLGCQAFYNIIENVIRNTAKHGKTEARTHVFKVKIREITDNELKDCDERLKEKANELYCVEIYDDIEVTDDALIENQNNKLNEEVLRENNDLRSHSLGMIEMDASAAYLRQLDIVSINDSAFELDHNDELYNSKRHFNIFKAFNASSTSGKVTLGYRFFVKRPQELIIVIEHDDKIKQTPELVKMGINIIDKQQFEKDLENHKVFNHQFLLIEDGIQTDCTKYQALLPLRKYSKTASEIKELLDKKEEIIEKLWEWRKGELLSVYKSQSDNILLDIYTYPLIKNTPKCETKFADHLIDIIKGTDEETLNAWNDHCNNKFYFEALSNKGQSQLPEINKIPTELNSDGTQKKKIVTYASNFSELAFFIPKVKVTESMLSRIIVIDERIQEILEETLYNIPYSEHFKMSNIYVPNKETKTGKKEKVVDLKADKIDIELINEYISWIINPGNNNIPFGFNPNYDFILIHYSLLERAYAALDKEQSKDRETWVSEWLSKYKENASIIVTSGRSNIKELPEHARFVNLSACTTALKEIKSKYLIHQIVYSSRKTK